MISRAGASACRRRPTGFKATVVGGEVTILDGEPTGARPGRLVRSRELSASRAYLMKTMRATRWWMHHVPSRADHVVDVAHAQRAQRRVAVRRHLVHDRVGVEARGVGANLEVDERVGEHVHARAAGVGTRPHGLEVVGHRLLAERAVDRAVGIEQGGERVVVALVDGPRVPLRELPEQLAVHQPLDG